MHKRDETELREGWIVNEYVSDAENHVKNSSEDGLDDVLLNRHQTSGFLWY